MARKSFNPEQLARYKRMAVHVGVFSIAAAIIGAAWFGGPEMLAHALAVPPMVLFLLLIASTLENILRIYRYKIFSNALHLPVPWGRMILYYVAGMALLPTPGKVGVVLRIWLLNHHHAIPYHRSAPLLVMDVLTDTLAMMAIVAMGIVALGNVHGAMFGLTLMGGLFAGVVMIMSFPTLAKSCVKLLYRTLGKPKPRLFAGLTRLLVLLHRMMGWRVLLSCTALSFVAWLGFGIALSASLGIMGYAPHWMLGGLVVSLGTVMGVVSMMPAGVGGAEASMTTLLVSLGDIPWGTAFILTMLVRMALIWIPVLIGFLALPWALKSPEHSPTNPPTT